MKKLLFLFVIIALPAYQLPDKRKIKIFLAGDSTMSIKDTKAYPETGWGMPFVYFWDSTVTVVNKARNGRSTRTFMEEGLWKSIVDEAGPGDYVLIQFGHNDEVPTKKSYVPENGFRANLIQYITDTRGKGARPILITPVARRKFDSAGHIVETHAVYAQIVRDVAKETQVPLIDLSEKSKALYQQLGPEYSKLLFNHLRPGEHPNYPGGKEDDTHFNELGARKIAEIILDAIKQVDEGLANHIIQWPVKN